MTSSQSDVPDEVSVHGTDEKSEELRKEILHEQVNYLIEAMGGPDAAAVVWTEDGWLDYLYRPGVVLARDEHWTEVAELLGAQRVECHKRAAPVNDSLSANPIR